MQKKCHFSQARLDTILGFQRILDSRCPKLYGVELKPQIQQNLSITSIRSDQSSEWLQAQILGFNSNEDRPINLFTLLTYSVFLIVISFRSTLKSTPTIS